MTQTEIVDNIIHSYPDYASLTISKMGNIVWIVLKVRAWTSIRLEYNITTQDVEEAYVQNIQDPDWVSLIGKELVRDTRSVRIWRQPDGTSS